MSSKKRKVSLRVGIFGGSFNPVHNGHLKLASHAFSELNLDKVIFVPSFLTPLKKSEKLLPFALRLKLLRAATKKHSHFSVSDCEIKRGGRSFTVDTIEFFKKKYGKQTTLFFLSGADVLKDLSRWKSLKKVLKLCRFVVATRPGNFFEKTAWPLLWMPFEALDVSASEIRQRLEEKKNIHSLVPSGTEKILRDFYRNINKV